jgi:NAD(P)-dependent dehydrogenase (short-subunit alcohol dehydrogenase family)
MSILLKGRSMVIADRLVYFSLEASRLAILIRNSDSSNTSSSEIERCCMPSRIVLITGCSTGIGYDVAQRLSLASYTVVATARHPERLSDLPVALQLPLDVTDPTSIASATKEVVRRFGRIDVLVNNAGYAVRGAVEDISIEQVQQIFDVNVCGVMRMIRAVVPYMRQQKSGRVITIGSLAGKLVLPVNGTYSATKFALEALSDALRLELAPFGIQVVLIEPGNIRSNFMATAQANSQEILSNPDSPYQALYQHYLRVMTTMRKQEPGPEIVSEVIQQAIEASIPKARYLVAVPILNRVVLRLGDKARDRIFRRMFKIGPSSEVD